MKYINKQEKEGFRDALIKNGVHPNISDKDFNIHFWSDWFKGHDKGLNRKQQLEDKK